MPLETPGLGLGSGSVADKIYAHEREEVEKERAKRPVIPCEVQAIRIGDLGIVTNGAEFFCQLGLDIKAASPLARTWVVSLANQWIGYVATPSAYYAGGYEPRTARSAKMAPWAGQSLVEGSLDVAASKSDPRGTVTVESMLARFADRFNSRALIHSSAARMARARVGHGTASQFGSPPSARSPPGPIAGSSGEIG